MYVKNVSYTYFMVLSVSMLIGPYKKKLDKHHFRKWMKGY